MNHEHSGALPPSPIIDRCKTGVLAPYALLAAMKLDVFTPLAMKALSAGELATELNLDPDRLAPLLYALAAIGLLRLEGERFSNADEAQHYLTRGGPHFIGEVWRLYDDLWRGALLAAESIQAGRPLAAHDYASMSSEQIADFFRGQHPDTLLTGWKLAEAVDFSSCRHLLDVAGGSGGLSIALCRRYPELRATIAELPAVVPIAEAHVREAGLDARIEVIATDLLAQPLAGAFDAGVARAFLQVLSPSQCELVLRHVRPALRADAPLYVLSQITDDERTSPESVALFNLIFLSFYEHGRSFTVGEHRRWLERAGFDRIESRRTATGLNMMIGRAAHAA
jgi:hypothetical protein